MKKLIFLLFIISSFTLYGQNEWSPEGATWYYSTHNSLYKSYLEVKYIGDSIINNQEVKVFSKYRYMKSWTAGDISRDSLGLEFTYQSGDTIFYYKFSEFYVLYNFNAKKDDTWQIAASWGPPDENECDSMGMVQVMETGTKNINGNDLKYFATMPSTDSDWGFYGDMIVERIGNISFYMFPEQFCMVDNDYGGTFICYQDSVYGHYGNESGCNLDWWVKETNIRETLFDKEKAMQCYPNPSKEQISIHYQVPPSSRSAHIRIFDVMGREVQREKVSINDDTFISKVPLPGVYFAVLEVDGVFVREEKMVVLGDK